MRIAFALALVVGCSSQVARYRGQATPEPTPNEIAQQLTEVRLMGLYCRMPEASIEQQVHRERDGAFSRTVSARSEGNLGIFAVIVTEWEDGMVGDPLTSARELADGLFRTQDLHDRRSQRVEAPGFYAREDTGLGDHGVFVVLRQYVGHDRIYLAMATIAQAPIQVHTAEAFMASITLDSSDALLPIAGARSTPRLVFMPEAEFAVRMPPLSEQTSSEVELGGQRLRALSFATAGAISLRLRVLELPEEPLEGELIDQTIAALSLGSLTGPAQASGYPGVEFVRESGGTSVHGRVFLTHARIYVLEVTEPASGGDETAMREFFESFRILT